MACGVFLRCLLPRLRPTRREGNESAAAPYIRWDIYKEIGYPQIKDLDGLLNVLKQMQDRARQDTGKDDIYAMSLFKDRDGDVMQNAASICSWFGYTNQGSVFISADGKDVQPATKEGGIYQQALEFLNKAESMGLVDPDSTTQDWDTMRTKVTKRQDHAVHLELAGQAAYELRREQGQRRRLHAGSA